MLCCPTFSLMFLIHLFLYADVYCITPTVASEGGEGRGGCTYNRRLLEQKTQQPGTNLNRERERNGEGKGGLYDFYKSQIENNSGNPKEILKTINEY